MALAEKLFSFLEKCLARLLQSEGLRSSSRPSLLACLDNLVADADTADTSEELYHSNQDKGLKELLLRAGPLLEYADKLLSKRTALKIDKSYSEVKHRDLILLNLIARNSLLTNLETEITLSCQFEKYLLRAKMIWRCKNEQSSRVILDIYLQEAATQLIQNFEGKEQYPV